MKAQHTRRLVITLSVAVALASAAVLVVLLSVDGLQKKHLSDLAKEVASQSSKLESEPQINKILTVQNQLASLSTLHNGKPEASQLFTYINQITPVEISINNLTTDFTKDTITVTGSSDSLSSVNKYIDTLKYTTYTTATNKTAKPAFTNVVLSSFSLNDSSSSDPTAIASYSVNFGYDPTIFGITQSAKLSVPGTTTTRPDSNGSGGLFKASTTSGGAQNGQ